MFLGFVGDGGLYEYACVFFEVDATLEEIIQFIYVSWENYRKNLNYIGKGCCTEREPRTRNHDFAHH